MPNSKHCLVIALPEGSVKHYLLTAREITIGRGDENSITLGWDTVSSRHCVLRKKGPHYEVIDQDSTNGTTLRGKRVGSEPREFREGDSLVIGLNVKARLVAVEEVIESGKESSTVDGSVTRKLKSPSKASTVPAINPVAAAVAKAAKAKR